MSENTKNVKGFIIKDEFRAGLDFLTREQKGALLEALFADMHNEEMPEMDTMTKAILAMMLPSIHSAQETYSIRSEANRENGRKGGLAKGRNASLIEKDSETFSENSENSDAKIANSENSDAKIEPSENSRIEKNRIEGNRIESKNTVTPLPPFEGEVVSDDEETSQSSPTTKRKRKEPTRNSKPELEAYIKAHAISDELQEALIAFNEMRTKIRKPLTGEALKLIFGQLRKLAPNDEAMQTQIVQQSVMNSWQGIFPLNVGQNQPRGRFNGLQSTQTLAEHNMQVIERVAERMRAQGMDV